MSINIAGSGEINVVNVGEEISQTTLEAINSANNASASNPFLTTITTQQETGIFTSISAGSVLVSNPAMGSEVFVGSNSISVGSGAMGLVLDWMGSITGVSGITFQDGTTQTTAGGGGGGGGSYLPLSGGTMTGAITFGTAGQNIDVGSFDNNTGGSNGISLYCAVNYELNWQGGFLENRYNGTTQPIGLNSSLMFGNYPYGNYTEISNNGFYWFSTDYSAYGEYTKQRFHIGTSGTLNPVWIDASLNMGSDKNPSIQLLPDGATGSAMKIDGFGLTFPDGTTQITATLGTSDQGLNSIDVVRFSAVNLGIANDIYELQVANDGIYFFNTGNIQSSIFATGATFNDGVSLTSKYEASGITFPDGTIQTKASAAENIGLAQTSGLDTTVSGGWSPSSFYYGNPDAPLSGYASTKIQIIITSTTDFGSAGDGIGLLISFDECIGSVYTDGIPIVAFANYNSGTLTNLSGQTVPCSSPYYNSGQGNYTLVLDVEWSYWSGMSSAEGCVIPHFSWTGNPTSGPLNIIVKNTSRAFA